MRKFHSLWTSYLSLCSFVYSISHARLFFFVYKMRKVEYALDGDRNLDFHTDDSEVTFNICLGDSFSGLNSYLLFSFFSDFILEFCFFFS